MYNHKIKFIDEKRGIMTIKTESCMPLIKLDGRFIYYRNRDLFINIDHVLEIIIDEIEE